MTLVNSLLILLFLFSLGLPLSFFCLRDKQPALPIILAPHCGLALLAILVANAYLLNLAVSRTVQPMVGLCLLSGAGGIWWILKTRQDQELRAGSFVVPAILFGLVFLVYSLPFILHPDLICYAYAGSDGSAYISTAEYQMRHGVYDAPRPDLYYAYSGLIDAFTRIRDNWVEKPGTMTVLAFFSSALSRLPHEVFSSLMITSTLLTFAAAFALARSLQYSPMISGGAAFLAAVSPAVLALSSNTYLGATIALTLFPVILLAAQDFWASRKSAFLFALVYAAYALVLPPGWLIPLAAAGPYIAYSAFRKDGRGARTILANAAVAISAFALLNTLTYRLYIRSLDFVNYALGSRSSIRRSSLDPGHFQRMWSLFWHTLGAGPVMASLATKPDLPAGIAVASIGVLGLLYFVRCIKRRAFSVLFFSYLSFWLVVLLGGVAGLFQSFEVLARVSQQFVCLHGLVFSSFVATPVSPGRGPRFAQAGVVALLLMAAGHQFKPFYDFERLALIDDPQRTNQYTGAALRARADIGSLVGQSPVLLSSAVPTYTGVANIATLFSNVRLALPPQFLKFFFLDHLARPEDYYCAPTVLVPEAYADVYEPGEPATLYRANSFRLVKNDLILFFDNDTFRIEHGFDVVFLKDRHYIQARVLSAPTVIHLCSAKSRTVGLVFRYQPLPHPRTVEVVVGPSSARRAILFGPEGRGTAAAVPLSKGENRIELLPLSAGREIEVVEISVLEESAAETGGTGG